MDLERDMRTLLHARADSVPTRADLLAGVRARRADHRRRRRRVVALALAAIVLAALPVVALSRWLPTVQPAVDLATPAALPEFPFTPTWEPTWVGLRSFRYLRTPDGSQATLRYEATYPQATTLTVTVTPTDPDLSGEEVDVGGRVGVLVQAAGSIKLAWRLPAGWAEVDALGPATRSEILQYARGLAPIPLRMDTPFTFTVLPADARLLAMDPSAMRFSRAGGTDALLTITLVPSAALGAVPEQPVSRAGAVVAHRRADQDRAVEVEVADTWGLTPEQVAAIARGVEVTPVAITMGG